MWFLKSKGIKRILGISIMVAAFLAKAGGVFELDQVASLDSIFSTLAGMSLYTLLMTFGAGLAGVGVVHAMAAGNMKGLLASFKNNKGAVSLGPMKRKAWVWFFSALFFGVLSLYSWFFWSCAPSDCGCVNARWIVRGISTAGFGFSAIKTKAALVEGCEGDAPYQLDSITLDWSRGFKSQTATKNASPVPASSLPPTSFADIEERLNRLDSILGHISRTRRRIEQTDQDICEMKKELKANYIIFHGHCRQYRSEM